MESDVGIEIPEPVRRAQALGHTVEWDQPAAMTAAERWTCTGCGRAVLRYGLNIYGSAVTDLCPAAPPLPRWRDLSDMDKSIVAMHLEALQYEHPAAYERRVEFLDHPRLVGLTPVLAAAYISQITLFYEQPSNDPEADVVTRDELQRLADLAGAETLRRRRSAQTETLGEER